LVHEFATTPAHGSSGAGCDVGDLDVRHPLERKVRVRRTSLAKPDDRNAVAVHQVIAPQRSVARRQDARVEAQDSLVFWYGDVGTKYAADR
jgi:hypothetical protein